MRSTEAQSSKAGQSSTVWGDVPYFTGAIVPLTRGESAAEMRAAEYAWSVLTEQA